MKFKGIQKTLTFDQVNNATPDKIFPLLCPEREKEWLDGWDYKMVYSQSGFIEQDCVFTTVHRSEVETVWQVTQYDPEKFEIEFLRVTPNENVVKINVKLTAENGDKTNAHISYQYTALNEQQNEFIKYKLEDNFSESMLWWETAINHFLKTGEKLIK